KTGVKSPNGGAIAAIRGFIKPVLW
ncbi:aliphatic sulfonates import ATP-binding protein SsuB, partial [Escherichia coli 96.0932]